MTSDDLISAVITPIDELGKRYRITISNNSPDILLDCEFQQQPLLHPGQFGLDDTHMPNDIWVQKPLQCDVLPTGSDISFEVNGYDVPSAYDGYWTSAKMSFRRLRANTTEPGDREERMVHVRLNWKISKGLLASR
jgi:hypothetical protein